MLSIEDMAVWTERSLRDLAFPDRPLQLYDPIRYALDTGGKRIRPLLTLGACALFTDEFERALPAALAVEVFHNFTLLHDDIMDRSSLRRGRPTVHVKWDENTAILSGDAMMIYAYELACWADPEKLPQILPLLNRIFMGVCQGQQYDMDFEHRTDVTAGEYLHMIGLKTAVLMAGAMQAGALLGGADETSAQRLYDAGMLLGTAFQLQDDLLDTYGDAAVWGKNIGDDIADNKKTYLSIRALELADDGDREQLLVLIGSKTDDREEKIRAVRDIYARAGVKELTETRVEDYFRQAEQLIDAVPVEEIRKQPLREIARMLIGRKK
jgi:geranylgeranyl diphosphate synthase type II